MSKDIGVGCFGEDLAGPNQNTQDGFKKGYRRGYQEFLPSTKKLNRAAEYRDGPVKTLSKEEIEKLGYKTR